MNILTRAQYEFVLRHDFTTFAALCFQALNPQTNLAMNWHLGGELASVAAFALTIIGRQQYLSW
jgi:hypothetical protein